jgi:hypothetical protein
MDWLASQFVREGWIDHWQTLIAGLIAILAAFVGGLFINRQISSAHIIEKERVERKFSAARAILPLTLSALSEYTQLCNSHLKTILATKRGDAIPLQATPTKAPTFPNGIIEDLRGIIEYSDKPIRTALVALVGKLQIQMSRLTTLERHLKEGPDNTNSIVVTNIEDYILDAADIYARCAALFHFARGATEIAPGGPLRADMHSALNQTGFWYDEFRRVHDRVDVRYER